MLIQYQFLLKKYNFVPKGIIHIGAHKAEECVEYARSGVKNVIWIEGNPNLKPEIEENISIYNQNHVFISLLSDKDNLPVSFNITNATMSSSILDLDLHAVHYPDIKTVQKIELSTKRLDTLISEQNIDITKYDFLNIDIQGAELPALIGMGDEIAHINYIYTEVNVAHLYKNCDLVDALDTFLTSKGFFRVELSLTQAGWGDAFYIRQEASKEAINSLIESAKNSINNYSTHKVNNATWFQLFKKRVPPQYLRSYNRLKSLKNKLFSTKPKIDLLQESGELENLKHYFEKNKRTSLIIFDVGGSIGSYSLNCISLCEQFSIKYTIYIFEPQSKCQLQLRELFRNNNNIIIVPLALSNEEKQIEIYKDHDGSSMASFYKRRIFSKIEAELVETTTLNKFIESNDLNHIDLLKIDTEGHELNVLQGANGFFHKINNIQFEYGGTYVDANTTLKDIYILLKPYFHIGKISTKGVRFTPFLPEMENFEYSNFFAEKI
jgi:FkbM family methyltransferase